MGRTEEAESGGSTSERIRGFEEQYREIAINCFRYLDFKSFAEVDALTIPEYNLLMEAENLKQVDRDYRNHLQAYLNFAAKAEKKKGKFKTEPVFKTFKLFYDYEKEVEKVTKPNNKSRFEGIGKFFKKGE